MVAIDSSRHAAPDGERSRCGERKLSRVCGIRYTPDRATIDSHPGGYYDWIRCGFALYERLDREADGWQPEVIECFPTASWTRWQGPRAGTRAAWTRAGLAALGLDELPRRTNQDARDAIAAAVTARLHHHGRTERYGDIVVLLRGIGMMRIGLLRTMLRGAPEDPAGEADRLFTAAAEAAAPELTEQRRARVAEADETREEARRNTRGRFEQWAKNPTCGANALSAVHNVRLEKAAGLEASFAQSPFAITRGNRFEAGLFFDDAQRLRAALERKGALTHGSTGFLDLRLRINGGVRLASVDQALAETAKWLRRIPADPSSAESIVAAQ